MVRDRNVMMIPVPDRLRALLLRDFDASEVALCAADDVPRRPGAAPLRIELPRGHALVVWVEDETADRDALERRLALVVASFRELLETALEHAPRATAAQRLHDELRALAADAGALDAAVIDAQSTVVWGAAEAPDAEPHTTETLAEVIPIGGRDPSAPTPSSPPPASPIDRAIENLRALPAVDQLARGGSPFAHHDREGVPPALAKSFASIYLVVLVFDAPFDELRAERAVSGRIGTLEHLVVALPPVDPSPIGARVVRRRG